MDLSIFLQTLNYFLIPNEVNGIKVTFLHVLCKYSDISVSIRARLFVKKAKSMHDL